MGKSCIRCAHVLREKWPKGKEILRCGYRGKEETAEPLLMTPQSVYGRVTQIFPEGKKNCAAGVEAPAWCPEMEDKSCTKN